jgi:hypothetical protein
MALENHLKLPIEKVFRMSHRLPLAAMGSVRVNGVPLALLMACEFHQQR